MGKRSTWTSKDDDLLRALAASGENSAAIAVRLNRTSAGAVKILTTDPPKRRMELAYAKQ
jgi:hypothetical protein